MQAAKIEVTRIALEPGDVVVVNGVTRAVLHMPLLETLVVLAHASKVEPTLYSKVCGVVSDRFPKVQLWEFSHAYEALHGSPFSFHKAL